MSADRALPPFVAPSWLAAQPHPAAGGPLVVDARWSLDGSEGEATFEQGHLPGAVYVDLDTVLADPPDPQRGRHPLPSPERFARDLGARGVADDVPVVAYDQGPGIAAARLVWMLRAIGQPAAVLDGGLAAWDGPLERGAVEPVPVSRRDLPWPVDRIVGTDAVAVLVESGQAVLLDARDPARFAGEEEPVDPRPGHIPGARSAPASDNLDGGALRPRAELEGRYSATGALDGERVVAYCGSGVAACHDLLVLETLGVDAELYPGSWSAWSADPSRPAATGPDPGR